MSACKVCGNSQNNLRHIFQEKHLGTGDEFEYVECGACNSLSIVDVPAQIERYYPSTYYSYRTHNHSRFAGWLKGRRDRYYLTGDSLVGRFISWCSPASPYIAWLKNLGLPYGSSILEIGSGNGALVVNLQGAGFNAIGIDPYIAEPILFPNGAQVLKQTLDEATGCFDCIMLHHSLEHMDNPGAVLRHVYRLLRPRGKALIRTPVAGSYAWRTYGAMWFQIDAPRHFVILSEQAFRTTAASSGFTIEQVIYDSQASQFWASEQYAKDISLTSERSYAQNPGLSIFSSEQIQKYENQAMELNKMNDGDQAAYYLVKID